VRDAGVEDLMRLPEGVGTHCNPRVLARYAHRGEEHTRLWRQRCQKDSSRGNQQLLIYEFNCGARQLAAIW
jgi:hypothetical protein